MATVSAASTAQTPGDQGGRDPTLRLGVSDRDNMRAAQAQQPFPVRPRRGSARDDAVEPFSRGGTGCVCVVGHRAGSTAEETPEAVNDDLGELVD